MVSLDFIVVLVFYWIEVTSGGEKERQRQALTMNSSNAIFLFILIFYVIIFYIVHKVREFCYDWDIFFWNKFIQKLIYFLLFFRQYIAPHFKILNLISFMQKNISVLR